MPRIADLPLAPTVDPGSMLVIDDPSQTPSTRRYEAGVVGSLWGGDGLSYTVPIVNTQEYVIARPATFEAAMSGGWSEDDGKLFCGSEGLYLVVANACLSKPSQQKQIRMRIALNGDDLIQTCARTSVGGIGNDPRVESLATHTVLELKVGDEITLAFANWSDATTFTLTNLQLTATRIR
jgi:hypothetical protein